MNELVNSVNSLKKAGQSWWGILLGALFFSFVMMYTYILPVNAIIPSRDYVLQLWDLWLVNENILQGQSPYFTELQYYPVGAHLGRHVLSPGFFPITFLVYLLSGADALYPLYTYKIVIWLSFALMFYFSYMIFKELEITGLPAVIPAAAYTFSDFYLNHIGRIHIISGFFIPLCALLLVKLYKRPGPLVAILSAVVFALPLYFTEFALFIYIGTGFVAGIMCLFPSDRLMLRHKLQTLGNKWMVVAGGVFLAVAAPFMYYWLTSDALPPGSKEANRYSTNLLSLFVPAQEATPLYGSIFNTLNTAMVGEGGFVYGVTGFEVFIGFPLLIFGIVALFSVKHRVVWLCALSGLVFFVLSLGPTLKAYNVDTQFSMPYALIAAVPPFNVNRNPVRFVALGLFFWMIVTGFGLQWFQQVLRHKYSQTIAQTALLLVLLWTVVEAYSPTEMQPAYIIPAQLETIVEGPVLNLPLKYHDGWSLLPQMFHKQPVATGYVSRNSKKQKEHFETLRVYYAQAVATGSCNRFVEMGYKNIFIWDGVPQDVIEGLSQSENCPLNIVDFRNAE